MERPNNHMESSAPTKKCRYQNLEVMGWGLFFIWIGIAVLADIGWGVGFIGIGLLILGLWTADKYLSKPDCSRS